ncbi:hypothetical protein Tco_0751032, partial [Tanacetum coccineum]
MDDPNITMEEYIKLEEEKSQRHGRTFNWQTAMFGKVESYEDEDDCFIDLEIKFPAIVFYNTLTSDTTLLCAPTASPPNKNKIDLRISLDESDDEDYTVIFDENSFSYKIISVSDLKKDLENDEILKPSSPKLMVDCLDDLDYFKDFKNEFPAIVYNDGLTSKSDLEVEPPISSRHINKFETSLSKYDEEGRNTLHVTFPDNLKTIKDSDENIDITQPSGHMAPLPTADQRHLWLRYQVEEYTEGIIHRFSSEVEDGVYWRGAAGICEMSNTEMGLDVTDTLCFQLDGVRRRMTWRQFILALGLHTKHEMAEAGFGA